jgi:molybdopterin converting factor small subunit
MIALSEQTTSANELKLAIATGVDPVRKGLPLKFCMQSVCTVLLFARARELAGGPSISLALPFDGSAEVPTLAALRKHLSATYPALSSLLASSSTLLTVNASYVDCEESTVLNPGDEIAVIPPVSGG